METLVQHELTPALLEVVADLVGGSVVVASAPFGRILFSAGAIAPEPERPTVGVKSVEYAEVFQIYTQHGEIARTCDLPLVRAIRMGKPVLNEAWVLIRAGEAIPIICDAYPLTDRRNRVLGGLCTSVEARLWKLRSDGLKVTLKIRDLLARSLNADQRLSRT